MQVEYDGKHSLLIGDLLYGLFIEAMFVNTWKDWHLIPVSRPVISPPKVQENSIEIPGMNGKVDLTTALTGYPLYYNRTGSIDFYVDNTAENWDWDIAYDTILNSLHGFTQKVILTDTPSFYYEGRLSVNSWKSDKLASTITIDYDLAPFKKMLWSVAEQWLWNPFDFIHGTIPDRSYFVTRVPKAEDQPNPPTGPTYIEHTLSGAVIGTMPTTFVLKVLTSEKVDWSQMINEEPPGMLITISGSYSRTYRISFTEEDDQRPAGGSSSYFVFDDDTMYIGSPEPRYSVIYRFINTFKNSNGDYIVATFTWDFRPGRL